MPVLPDAIAEIRANQDRRCNFPREADHFWHRAPTAMFCARPTNATTAAHSSIAISLPWRHRPIVRNVQSRSDSGCRSTDIWCRKFPRPSLAALAGCRREVVEAGLQRTMTPTEFSDKLSRIEGARARLALPPIMRQLGEETSWLFAGNLELGSPTARESWPC